MENLGAMKGEGSLIQESAWRLLLTEKHELPTT